MRLRPPRPAPAVHGWRSAPSAPFDPALLRSDTCVTVLPLVRCGARSVTGGAGRWPPPGLATSGSTVVASYSASSSATVALGRRRCGGGGLGVDAARLPTPSSRCLPIRLPAGSSIGYCPSKQAMQSRVFGCSVACDQAVQGNVAQRVGADRAPDAVDLQAVGDQLGPGGEVDAVEARPLHRRRRDPHVHLERAGLAQHADHGRAGCCRARSSRRRPRAACRGRPRAAG